MSVKPSSKWKDVPAAIGKSWQKIHDLTKELEKEGKEVIGLHEGDLPVYGYINETLDEILADVSREGWSMYPSSTTLISRFKNAISNLVNQFTNVYYSPEDIIVAPGVAGCWQVLQYSLLEPNDEILVIEPAHYIWAPAAYIQYFGSIKVVTCRTDEAKDWEPDIEDLRTKISGNTKAIVIVHPNNPTGAIYSEKSIKAIIDTAGEYKVPIISDEIYQTVSFDGITVKPVAALAKDVSVITFTSMSKFFMSPGWRCGYICFHDPEGGITELKGVANKVAGMYGHATSCIPTPILSAATRAFESCTHNGSRKNVMQYFRKGVVPPIIEAGHKMLKELQKNRDFIWKRLNEVETVSCTKPKAGLYAFPRVDGIGKTWKDDEDFVVDLLKEEGIMFVPGSYFGESGCGHFRTIFTPKIEILENVFDRFEKYIMRKTA